jgi:hypothetical protein
VPYGLEAMARLALVAAYSGGRHSCSSRERANVVVLAVLLISQMWSSLSMRGTIRLWWRLARTEAAPTRHPPGPLAFRSDSSHSWRKEGDTP